MSNETVDTSKVADSCKRLFAYRKQQSWPCTVNGNERWPELHSVASKGLPVIDNVDDAIVWANDLIARIEAAD